LIKDTEWISAARGNGKDIVHREGIEMSDLLINYCKQEQMSICTANSQEQQIGCSYYEKSQFAERCMYFIFEEYCDCLTAQMHAQQETQN
jgi:hypothetical protein